MQPSRTSITVALLAAVIIILSLHTALAQSESPPDSSGLSPYWSPNVVRWEPFILSAAEERNVDPNLIAAVIWKESLGRAWERGPVGAVGLMGVMPFDWRPSAEELENPWTNVSWGTRALVHTIRDGQGDLYYSLAAYNGGWEQIYLRVTRGYAADVLNHYTRATAVQHGLPADGDWVAIFAIEGAPDPNTITVIGPQRSLVRYTERPWIQADIPTVPVGVPPHTTVITFVDEYGIERQVNAWLVTADASPLVPSTAQTISPSAPADSEKSEYDVIHTPTPAATLNAAPTQPPSPMSTPLPPTTTLTTTLAAECAGGPLQLNAWSLGKKVTRDGWTATIFVQGHGGDCTYTYTWEGEIKGGPMSDSMTFDLFRADRGAVIMGTASVTSAGETVEVGLFLKP